MPVARQVLTEHPSKHLRSRSVEEELDLVSVRRKSLVGFPEL
jgi:hypothetical protein